MATVRYIVKNVDEARAFYVDHLGFALRHFLYDDAGMNLVEVNDDLLDRLQRLAGLRVVAHQHLRP